MQAENFEQKDEMIGEVFDLSAERRIAEEVEGKLDQLVAELNRRIGAECEAKGVCLDHEKSFAVFSRSKGSLEVQD